MTSSWCNILAGQHFLLDGDKSGDGRGSPPCDRRRFLNTQYDCTPAQAKFLINWHSVQYSPDKPHRSFGTAPCSEVIQRRNKKLGGMYCMIACVESHGVWGRQIEQNRWNVTNLHCRKSVDYISRKMMQPPPIILRVRCILTHIHIHDSSRQQINYSNNIQETQHLRISE